ncbi:MAG: hypothetical protein FJY40_06565 [Betaproteobacteria bacterium]|nr:hypothetical protein [Betaproteobacteria bacterium]MBM3384780.1 hypothetical protein [Betaproteobacteria bacterium]
MASLKVKEGDDVAEGEWIADLK